MTISSPKKLLAFLKSLNAFPKKQLSQNFLIDNNIIKKILQESNVNSKDVVLEIGPGPGALTEALVESGAKILTVEKDEAFAKALPRLQKEENKLKTYCHDIMTFPIEEKLKENLSGKQKAKVIANLPYQISAPILTRLVAMNDFFSSIHVMVQEEVARRITASPKSSGYNSLTVFLNFHSKTSYAFGVNRSCFYPQPKVDSAIISLQLTPPPRISSKEHFFKMIRTAFGQRRKMLRSSLKKFFPPQTIIQALESIKSLPTARPEELSLEKFIHFFEFCMKR